MKTALAGAPLRTEVEARVLADRKVNRLVGGARVHEQDIVSDLCRWRDVQVILFRLPFLGAVGQRHVSDDVVQDHVGEKREDPHAGRRMDEPNLHLDVCSCVPNLEPAVRGQLKIGHQRGAVKIEGRIGRHRGRDLDSDAERCRTKG